MEGVASVTSGLVSGRRACRRRACGCDGRPSSPGETPSPACGPAAPRRCGRPARASTSTSGPTRSTHGARMNTACTGSSSPSKAIVALERVDLSAKGVAPHGHIDRAERDGLAARRRRRPGSRWPAGSSPRTSRRPACLSASRARSGSSNSNSRSRWLIVVDSPPGITSASTASSSVTRRTVVGFGTRLAQRRQMFAGVALQREHADARRAHSRMA